MEFLWLTPTEILNDYLGLCLELILTTGLDVNKYYKTKEL